VSFILLFLRYLLFLVFIFSSRFYKRSAGFVLDSCQFWAAFSVKYRRLEFINKFQWQCALVCMSTLHQEIQVPHFTESTSEVWMWEGAIISLSPLLLYGKAESSHAATHPTYSWHKHINKTGFQILDCEYSYMEEIWMNNLIIWQWASCVS